MFEDELARLQRDKVQREAFIAALQRSSEQRHSAVREAFDQRLQALEGENKLLHER